MSAYEKNVTYRFGGGEWEITSWNDDSMFISETRKNGQEDCHISFVAELKRGKWTITEGRGMIEDYGGGEADIHFLENHLNEHGLPESEKAEDTYKCQHCGLPGGH